MGLPLDRSRVGLSVIVLAMDNRSRDIAGVLYGTRLIEQPHVKSEVDRVLKFTEHPSVHVEIGFDFGYRILDMAKRNPAARFLGLEVRERQVVALTNSATSLGLQNLLAWRMDARTVFHRVLNNSSIDSVDILFPTPWWDPKKRVKRLLLTTVFLQAVACCLKPHGWLRVKTDVAQYREEIEALLAHQDEFVCVDRQSLSERFPSCETRSRRELKCARENLKIYEYYLEKK